MRKQKNKNSKIFKGIIMSLCPLIAIYLGISVYFINHFYFGSTINCINVAGKTVDEANEEISSEIGNYKLNLDGRGDSKDEISGSEINLKYEPQGKVEELRHKQKALKWITSILKKEDTQLNELVSFDEDLLKDKVESLSFLNNDNIIEPENASFEYTGNGYKIVDEVKGNKVNKDVLYENISKAIRDGETTLNLDTMKCYEEPQYTSESSKTIEAKKVLDNYTDVKITYNFEDRQEVVDGTISNDWLDVDDDMNVIFNENKVRHYVEILARKYNTFANTRDFTTSSGNSIKVSGGNYGWIIDKAQETKDLIECIKTGQDSVKEPAYSQTAVSRKYNDVGDTYVELDMTKQHLWFYKNGALVVEGDVVTGNASLNYSTPVGTYRLNYKEKNATLKGENYSSPVTYWLPFNDNIGIHDATWRYEFGKQIYLTNGSHGCVNAPYEVAEKIFQNIEAGTPVICYYE